MSYESKIEDGIIIFKFNNPKVNAIDMNVIKGLDDAVDINQQIVSSLVHGALALQQTSWQ